jgi:hypothetical protein
MIHKKMVAGVLAISALLGVSAQCQSSAKPLTNDDIIAMVRKKLPESVIVSAIQAGPCQFNTSSKELIRLNSAGVTENELNAILSASGKGQAVPAPAAESARFDESAAALPPTKSRMPRLFVKQKNSSQELPFEKTQLAETRTKPSSMKALAADSAVTQAMQAEVNSIANSAAMHINSGVGGAAVQQAGGVFSGIMSHRTPAVTYVWGVPNPASGNVLQSNQPVFTLDFSRVIGVNPDEYGPAIVKLTPAQNTCRIVGATQGKQDAASSPASDWQVYSHFLEEPVASSAEKLGPGKYAVSTQSELPPGEYGIVLRPLSRSKKFSGGDVARAQGDGLMFDAIWTFQIADSAE